MGTIVVCKNQNSEIIQKWVIVFWHIQNLLLDNFNQSRFPDIVIFLKVMNLVRINNISLPQNWIWWLIRSQNEYFSFLNFTFVLHLIFIIVYDWSIDFLAWKYQTITNRRVFICCGKYISVTRVTQVAWI